jgi:hypothetical protein
MGKSGPSIKFPPAPGRMRTSGPLEEEPPLLSLGLQSRLRRGPSDSARQDAPLCYCFNIRMPKRSGTWKLLAPVCCQDMSFRSGSRPAQR